MVDIIKCLSILLSELLATVGIGLAILSIVTKDNLY